MRVVEALTDPAARAAVGAVVGIGNFDGVHLGHRALLERMRALADAHGRPAVVVTFFPPAKVLFGGASYLSSREEKLALLEAFAPDVVVVVPFDHAFAGTDASEFVARLAALEPTAFVVGRDFRFGEGRRGSVADLAAVAPIEDVGVVTVDGERVASTWVRELLASGDVERAARLLGAPYPVTGRVAMGDQRGRTIGFPTANLSLDPAKALPLGVFAVTVATDAGTFGGMANVGPRPSFPDDPPSLEVHLFGFDGDLYDRTITVRFHRKLRDQRRFASLDELKAQLAADERAARAALAEP